MWPFSTFRKRVHARRKAAARAVLVSAHSYAELTPDRRQKVEDFLIEYFKTHSEIPYTVLRDRASFEYLAAYRALAMSRLGYATGTTGLDWNELLLTSWRLLPATLATDFQRFHAATDEAIEELKVRGIEISDSSTMGSRWLESLKQQYP